MNLAQEHKIVFVIEPEDHQAAGISGDSVNMAAYGHGCWIFQFGELTANSVLTMESGATDGTETTAETFRYRCTSADLKTATGDALGAEATSAALTLTHDTFEDRILVVEMDTDELTEDQYFMTPVIDSTASVLLVSCICVLSEPRYSLDVMPPAIPIA